MGDFRFDLGFWDSGILIWGLGVDGELPGRTVNPQSVIRNPQSAIRHPQIPNRQSGIKSQIQKSQMHSPIPNRESAIS
jgi:hypothetical protein